MKELILLNPKTGVALRWAPPRDLLFLRQVALLPVQATEAGRIGAVLPLAFYRDLAQPSGWSMMAVCGRGLHQNAMISSSGQWLAGSLPESVRYLPFALRPIGGGRAIPAIDPTFAGGVLGNSDPSVPLYGSDGKLHKVARARVDYLLQHQAEISRTQKIIAALSDANLITPWPDAAVKAGKLMFTGLYTIDERKLSQLDDETFLQLRRSGAVALAYSCLLSLYQVRNLANLDESSRVPSGTELPTVGALDLEFMNDDETIKFGPLQ